MVKSMAPGKVLDWLLEPEEPSVRYLTLTRVLGKSKGDPEVRAARKRIPQTGWAASILARRDPAGWWVRDWSHFSPSYTSTTWMMVVLSDLGLSRETRVVEESAQLWMGMKPLRYGATVHPGVEPHYCSLGMGAAERDKFIAKQRFPLFDGSQEYCLWLACMGSYDPRGREIVADFARVMQALGTSFGVLKKESCTGDPARRLGNDLLFGELAEQGLKNFAQAGVKKIVTVCPHCVRTIAGDWREYGVAPEIEHHSEFMARHAALLERLMVGEQGGSIVYHDPCYLGRYREVYEPPRAVVAMAGELVEAERHRERSFCCGAGGGLAFLGEEAGDRVSHGRARELMQTGAKTIGTACPFCNSMFRDALGEVGGAAPPQLLDIAQLVARRLPAQALDSGEPKG